jgi:hypothetical protein
LGHVTSLEEVERHYSIDDLFDANEALDIKLEQEQFEMERATREARRKR